MARDYAKSKQGTGTRAPAARKKQPRRSNAASAASPPRNNWRWFGAGLLTGVFLSFLLYLGTLPTPGELAPEQAGEPAAAAESPKPRFDFYTLLPEQTIDVEIEPGEVATPAASHKKVEIYLLQAGSFRQREDADRRRAELLLLGLEPKVEETNGDNGRWYRVYVGPFESHSKMSRARSLTANQDIDTLLLKRGQP